MRRAMSHGETLSRVSVSNLPLTQSEVPKWNAGVPEREGTDISEEVPIVCRSVISPAVEKGEGSARMAC